MTINVQELRAALATDIVELSFIKVSTGELRTVFATMNPEYLPVPKEPKNPSKSRPVPEDNLLFWDLDALSFKSCKIENIVEWKPE